VFWWQQRWTGSPSCRWPPLQQQHTALLLEPRKWSTRSIKPSIANREGCARAAEQGAIASQGRGVTVNSGLGSWRSFTDDSRHWRAVPARLNLSLFSNTRSPLCDKFCECLRRLPAADTGTARNAWLAAEMGTTSPVTGASSVVIAASAGGWRHPRVSGAAVPAQPNPVDEPHPSLCVGVVLRRMVRDRGERARKVGHGGIPPRPMLESMGAGAFRSRNSCRSRSR
jgi:hypothetical protein